jgi:hypothetical protein
MLAFYRRTFGVPYVVFMDPRAFNIFLAAAKPKTHLTTTTTYMYNTSLDVKVNPSSTNSKGILQKTLGHVMTEGNQN